MVALERVVRSIRLLGEDSLHVVPQSLIDDGVVLTRIGLAPMDDLTAVKPILEDVIECSDRDRPGPVGFPFRSRRALLTMPS